MSDDIIKSTDVNPKEPVKKTTAKKNAVKKTEPKIKADKDVVVNSGYKIIVFESGASYVSGEVRFTRQDNIKELPEEEANRLLEFDNFRLPEQWEIEAYLNSRED